MKRSAVLVDLFLEFLVAAVAEGLVALAGWVGRKVYRRWKKRRARPEG